MLNMNRWRESDNPWCVFSLFVFHDFPSRILKLTTFFPLSSISDYFPHETSFFFTCQSRTRGDGTLERQRDDKSIILLMDRHIAFGRHILLKETRTRCSFTDYLESGHANWPRDDEWLLGKSRRLSFFFLSFRYVHPVLLSFVVPAIVFLLPEIIGKSD